MHRKNELGVCVICGSRVHTTEDFLESEEGYCHTGCLNSSIVS